MILRRCFKLHYWPVLTCIWLLSTFVLTFTISTLNGHVYPYFPYISDTGSLSPESCIFGQMMNLGAVLMAMVIYIRYRQIKFAINSKEINISSHWNFLSAIFGYISCLGISVVGNFQETSMFVIHMLGAAMIFGSGFLVMLIQTRITFTFRHIYNKNKNYWIGPKIFYLRVVTTICCGIFANAVLMCGVLSLPYFEGTTIIYWTKEMGAYEEHLGSTISEWLMVIMFFIYILTFSNDFKSLGFQEVYFKNKNISSKETNTETV